MVSLWKAPPFVVNGVNCLGSLMKLLWLPTQLMEPCGKDKIKLNYISFCYSETSLESHSYSYKLLFFHFLLLFKHLTKNTAIRTPWSLVPWCFPMHWQNHKCGNVVYKWFYLLIDGEFSQTSHPELMQLEWTPWKRQSCCVFKLMV